jgi:hypothetical protein
MPPTAPLTPTARREALEARPPEAPPERAEVLADPRLSDRTRIYLIALGDVIAAGRRPSRLRVVEAIRDREDIAWTGADTERAVEQARRCGYPTGFKLLRGRGDDGLGAEMPQYEPNVMSPDPAVLAEVRAGLGLDRTRPDGRTTLGDRPTYLDSHALIPTPAELNRERCRRYVREARRGFNFLVGGHNVALVRD